MAALLRLRFERVTDGGTTCRDLAAYESSHFFSDLASAAAYQPCS